MLIPPPTSPLQIWLDIDNSGHYQSCVQTEKGDARMRMPEKGHFGVSASTGSFGDTHVVYSFQLADLEDGDIHDVEATPYTGTDKTSHRVHLDSKSHETHVKVTPTPPPSHPRSYCCLPRSLLTTPIHSHPQVANHPANLDGDAKGAMAHASEEASHVAAAPPSLDDGSKMLGKISDQMAGVRLSLQGIRGGLNNTRFTVDRLAETAQKTLAAATDGASRQARHAPQNSTEPA